MSSLLKLPALLGQFLPPSGPPPHKAGLTQSLQGPSLQLPLREPCSPIATADCNAGVCVLAEAVHAQRGNEAASLLPPASVAWKCAGQMWQEVLPSAADYCPALLLTLGQDEQLTPCPHMVSESPLMLFPLSRTPSSKFCLLKCPLFFKSCSRATSSQVSLGLLALPTSPPHPAPECVICRFV